MASRLTDKQVLALKAAPGQRLEVFDAQEPGLMIRVSDAGRRTWFFRYRLPDGRQPRFKLGTYPATGIADAREKAQDARRLVEKGQDPAAIERKREADARAQVIRTYDDLVGAYFEASEAGIWKPRGRPKSPKTIKAERELYERHIKKALGRRQLAEVGRTEVRTLTRGMLAKGITTQSNHAHALIRQTFSYALDEELVPHNPIMSMASPAPKKARERVLSDDELKAFWAALEDHSALRDDDGEPITLSAGVSTALRLTALLLQRRVEIAGMRADQLDLAQAVWTVPAELAKNRRAHVVPLCPSALALIKSALARADEAHKRRYGDDAPPLSPGRPVFPSPRGEGEPIHPDALTRAMGRLTKALGFPLAGPHDLRRTGASILASERVGVAPFVISQVLNHVTDAGGGSATTRRHYNLHLYAAEKRRALEAWETLLVAIVSAKGV